MIVSIEQHVDWIAECLAYLRDNERCSRSKRRQEAEDAVGRARERHRRLHAVPTLQLLVSRRQRSRQATRVHAPARLPDVRREVQRRRRQGLRRLRLVREVGPPWRRSKRCATMATSACSWPRWPTRPAGTTRSAICKMMRGVTRKKPEMWGDAIVGFGTHSYRNAVGRRKRLVRRRFLTAEAEPDRLHRERLRRLHRSARRPRPALDEQVLSLHQAPGRRRPEGPARTRHGIRRPRPQNHHGA